MKILHRTKPFMLYRKVENNFMFNFVQNKEWEGWREERGNLWPSLLKVIVCKFAGQTLGLGKTVIKLFRDVIQLGNTLSQSVSQTSQ